MATVTSDLAQIRKTVRRLARKPSANDVSNADIDEAINTFLLYDFPEILALFDMRGTFSFFTSPNIPTYYTNPATDDTPASTDPMTDFKNLIITSHTPAYIAGYRSYMTMDETDFFNRWPKVQDKIDIGTGNGTETNFSGTLSDAPVGPRQVLFSSIDANGAAQQLEDRPVVSPTAAQLGIETINGNLYNPRAVVPEFPTSVVASNTINYKTGVYNITFTVAPANGETVFAQVYPYQPGRPNSILYYHNTFTLRPIPDGSYEVKIEAYKRPTELLSDTQEPSLEQHWQFIAYGAAIKLLQWFTDFKTVEALMPEFETQLLLVNRRTLRQMDDERSATMFSQSNWPFGFGYRNWRR